MLTEERGRDDVAKARSHVRCRTRDMAERVRLTQGERSLDWRWNGGTEPRRESFSRLSFEIYVQERRACTCHLIASIGSSIVNDPARATTAVGSSTFSIRISPFGLLVASKIVQS